MKFNSANATWRNVFCVPSTVVDKYIENISGIYLKVLLVLLRSQDSECEISDIAKKIGGRNDEVVEALRFWIKEGVIGDGFGESETKSTPKPAMNNKSVQPTQSAQSLTSKEVSDLVKNNAEVKFLLDSAEMLFAKPITATEQKTLVSMHEWIGLPVDVVLMIVDYCISTDKKNIRYMEKVAISWADDGINTHELAEKQIKLLKRKNNMINKVKDELGIYGRNLTAKETEFLETWVNLYKYKVDVIKLAADKTIESTGKITFPYIHKILSSWNEKGYKTLKDAQSEKKPQRQNGKKTSFNIDEFEKIGIYDIPEVNN